MLVLGSLPGLRSLEAGRYYAHPQNAFWTIVAPLCGTTADAPYDERVQGLTSRGIALWDVCRAATRRGSLDAAIERESVLPNDFGGFYANHPAITRILFNGATAARLYRRHVLPSLAGPWRELPLVVLPSTSPAHAAMNRVVKAQRWCVALAAEGRMPSASRTTIDRRS